MCPADISSVPPQIFLFHFHVPDRTPYPDQPIPASFVSDSTKKDPTLLKEERLPSLTERVLYVCPDNYPSLTYAPASLPFFPNEHYAPLSQERFFPRLQPRNPPQARFFLFAGRYRLFGARMNVQPLDLYGSNPRGLSSASSTPSREVPHTGLPPANVHSIITRLRAHHHLYGFSQTRPVSSQ